MLLLACLAAHATGQEIIVTLDAAASPPPSASLTCEDEPGLTRFRFDGVSQTCPQLAAAGLSFIATSFA